MRPLIGFIGGIIACMLLHFTTHTQSTTAYVIFGMLGGGYAGCIAEQLKK